MSTKTGKGPGRPKSTVATMVVYGRYEKALIDDLDAIGAGMSIKASRNQLIEAAIREYVEKHRKPDRK